jgi:hypothetical protein
MVEDIRMRGAPMTSRRDASALRDAARSLVAAALRAARAAARRKALTGCLRSSEGAAMDIIAADVNPYERLHRVPKSVALAEDNGRQGFFEREQRFQGGASR